MAALHRRQRAAQRPTSAQPKPAGAALLAKTAAWRVAVSVFAIGSEGGGGFAQPCHRPPNDPDSFGVTPPRARLLADQAPSPMPTWPRWFRSRSSAAGAAAGAGRASPRGRWQLPADLAQPSPCRPVEAGTCARQALPGALKWPAKPLTR